MPSNTFLSQDAAGVTYDEEVVIFAFAQESSALTGSAAASVPVKIAHRAGRVVGCFIGVATPATSASGFVSGTVDAGVRINSAAVLSTNPSIVMAGSAAQAIRKSTNAGGGVSAVVNAGSAAFVAGAQISVDWNARSVGSAAAGAAGSGLIVGVLLRYDSV
tara:strand:+ start:2717 stop:3199 length:483 start_codon:yes stop_codon:yes gene_type:complete